MADAPTIYRFSKITGEYLGQVIARIEPREKKPLIPAGGTLDAPPSAAANKVAVFSSGSWSLVDDYRGQVFYSADGTKIEITDLGTAPQPAWTTTPPPRLLVDLQKEGKQLIDAAAETSRLQFITPGSGQSIVYDLKRAESEKYLAATNPVDANYPLMLERATRKSMTMLDVANEWKTKTDALTALAATIEGLREGGKDAVDLVTDDANAATNIDAIVSGITWPAPA